MSYILEGGLVLAAVAGAGLNVRTFREWMARGEDHHPTRPCTPKLRAFAKAIRKATAQRLLIEQFRLYKDNPLAWFKMAGQAGDLEGFQDSKQDRAGDSPPIEVPFAYKSLTEEQLARERMRLDRARMEQGEEAVGDRARPCPDAHCSCLWHDNWRRERDWLASLDEAQAKRSGRTRR